MARSFTIDVTYAWWFRYLYAPILDSFIIVLNIDCDDDKYNYWLLKAIRINGKRIEEVLK